MKAIATIWLSFLFCSCVSKQKETDQLNQRISNLEHQMDSLTGVKRNSGGNDTSPSFYGLVPANGRCQAVTKKGTQCKRKGKANSYCYQHGG